MHLRGNAVRPMIRNGLYSISTKTLDGVQGGATGISVLRNGKMLGGGSERVLFRWKQETTPTAAPLFATVEIIDANPPSDAALNNEERAP